MKKLPALFALLLAGCVTPIDIPMVCPPLDELPVATITYYHFTTRPDIVCREEGRRRGSEAWITPEWGGCNICRRVGVITVCDLYIQPPDVVRLDILGHETLHGLCEHKEN